VCGVKRLLVGLAALAALGAATPAHASIPMPWCGTDSSAVDRLPDATPGFAVHVVYVRAPGAADRFGELAPRIVGDVTAMEAWWRSQDATRAPRFDLFPIGCATAFGALDITNVQLSQAPGSVPASFNAIRLQLASARFNEPEKVYLVYYDGSTGQSNREQVCGQGATPGGLGSPGMAVVYLDACGATTSDSLRPVVGMHELVHALGAVNDAAPHRCREGHVCDFELDLMGYALSGEELESHVLDSGHDDYYAHPGSWTDVQDSLFLERLDSPDRSAPTPPAALVVRSEPGTALVTFSWRASSDDVGPVTYWVYANGRFLDEVFQPSAFVAVADGTNAATYSVRALDAVGHLSQPATVRFRPGLGIVDEQGRLLRDTVPPPALRSVSIRRTAKTSVLSWPAVRDPGGLRNYRIKIGARTLFVTKPAVTITRRTLRTAVSVAAVDRAGNIGPATTVPLRRLH
jgi:hypothetical protein